MLGDGRILGRRRADAFTLQWHLTNACELHCRHCYDRSQPGSLPIEQALEVLRCFLAFCDRRRVRPRLCLTGGNPFLYPGFFELYQAAARAQVPLSILGNPVGEALIERLLAIRKPTYYQVSLEGLEATDDEMRGIGHFQRTLRFLATLKRLGVCSHVMLTLNLRNLSEVLPLAESLRGLADRFTFNRLSQVGEGATLAQPTLEEYRAFLRDYALAAERNPALRFKDNLFNLDRRRRGQPLLGGCTGYGCGAAFNFIALLPTGEAHACRKFPSPIGDVAGAGFDAVYDSPEARRYRLGCTECRFCSLRSRCGGCLAVTYGQGRDPLRHRDPHCFRGAYSPSSSAMGTRAPITKAMCSSRGRPRASAPP